MTNELWLTRDEQLADALKKAIQELLAHQSVPPADIDIPLDDGRVATVSVQDAVADDLSQHPAG